MMDPSCLNEAVCYFLCYEKAALYQAGGLYLIFGDQLDPCTLLLAARTQITFAFLTHTISQSDSSVYKHAFSAIL